MSARTCTGVLLSVGLVCLGCATWVEAKSPVEMGALGVSAELPVGWMRLQTRERIVITRDGLGLQYIEINRSPIDEELPNTNRPIEAGMLPFDVAELCIDSARLSEETTSFALAENAPASIDGRECYRIDYSYRLGSGLPVRTRRYGCVVGEFHYWIEYRAAAQHYFDAYVDDFERVTRSVRISS